MAFVPRSLLTLGASLLSARAAGKLRRDLDSRDAQEAVFAHLIPKLALASVWREAGIRPRMDYATFQAGVPLHTYADMEPHIGRMRRGATDVLWPGRCQIYCVSSGTTEPEPKYIPMTEAMLDHFKRCGIDSTLWYAARTKSSRVLRGRHLFTGGSTALAPIAESEPFEAYSGELSGIAALNMPGWVEKQLYEPGMEISQIADWPAKVAAIAERTATLDITLLAGIPNWILVLADALREKGSVDGERAPNLQAIWPNLECFTHGGVPIAPFQDELHAALGPQVTFNEVYRAAEGFFAAQDADSAAGLRLMANAGIFFEFLDMTDFDESRLAVLGPQAVPLSGVTAGVDYALIVTTCGGLVRYLVGDVVRFTSTEPARLTYVGRTKLRLDAFGENVTEKEITDALTTVCRHNGWPIVNFHVAPFFPSFAASTCRGRHEWWVELKARTAITPTGPIIAVELDAELRRQNPRYASLRAAGTLGDPYVRLVMPGVFEHWMRFHGKWGGQNKMPRCRPDRVIADELGKALQFAKD